MADSIIDRLTQSFLKFPGIGPRQARRFVYYLLRTNHGNARELARQIEELRVGIRQCAECQRFFPASAQVNSTICNICNDNTADHGLLMVVEKDIDLENIRKSDTYAGRYFVLGGLAPILTEHPERSIRAQELENLIKHRLGGSSSKLREIIIALSVNPEGDYTVEVLKKLLAPLAEEHDIKITLLGRGLSTGTELEYSDADTLKNAIKNRS
ncbi:MAG: toprim domain-containing protein [Patescibacteria group bacterium]|nr:toprim domain-containing protein [Patescibacteria group bacterium]